MAVEEVTIGDRWYGELYCNCWKCYRILKHNNGPYLC